MTTTPDWAAEVDDLVEDLSQHLGHLPYDATPERLYTAAQLYEDLRTVGFSGCIDQRIYARAKKAGGPAIGPVEALAQRLHDHGITVALDQFRKDRRIVGVMGGHDMVRGSDDYRMVVSLGRALAGAGLCVATGGGPGAMEAANLGAATSGESEGAVSVYVDRLATEPTFHGNVDGFTGVAMEVWEAVTSPVESLSVPTWFYGHEPSNPFATHIAKYFSNSEREDGLLAIATAGIVFVSGGPGTLQEVFQDAAQNAYQTYGSASPMVFLDRPGASWWAESGVLPALEQAFTNDDGSKRPGWKLIAATDDLDRVVELLS